MVVDDAQGPSSSPSSAWPAAVSGTSGWAEEEEAEEEEDVCERGVRVPTLQADRAAVRLPGSVSGPGGSAQSRLGHRGPLLPVAVGVLLPVRRTAPGRGAPVELLLHSHVW